MKATKKPVEIEYIQFTGQNFKECEKFLEGNYDNTLKHPNVRTQEGVLAVEKGYYIIRGNSEKLGNHYWPVDPDYFHDNYDTSPPSLPTAGAKEKAEVVYSRMTSFANYEQMNGIERSWFLKCIREGLESFNSAPTITAVVQYSDIGTEIHKHLGTLKYEGGYPGSWKETLSIHLTEWFNDLNQGTTIGISDAEIEALFPQNPNATYEDEVRDNLNQGVKSEENRQR